MAADPGDYMHPSALTYLVKPLVIFADFGVQPQQNAMNKLRLRPRDVSKSTRN